MRQQFSQILNPARKCLKAAAVAVFVFSAKAALAVETGLEATASQAGLRSNQTDLGVLIGKIVGQLMGFVGVIFFVLMIYGGFLWMTAQGNEEQIKKAKSLITGAVIGIIIVFSAYAITSFVITNVGESTGIQTTGTTE